MANALIAAYVARRPTQAECSAHGVNPADAGRSILIEHAPGGARAVITFADGGPTIEALMQHEDGQRIMRAMLAAAVR